MLDKPKPNKLHGLHTVNAVGKKGKECVSTRGDLTGGGKRSVVTTNCKKSAEAIVSGKEKTEENTERNYWTAYGKESISPPLCAGRKFQSRMTE